MQDIFICPNGNMLDNWEKAFPKALAISSLTNFSVNEPTLFWVHANANNKVWLDRTMDQLAQQFQDAKVVVLANTPNQPDALAVLAKGVVGYCHAYSAANMLQELKTVVMHGGIWLGRDLLKTLIGATKTLVHNSSENVKQALTLLTARETQVAIEAAEGFSNKEIARSLDITERTVKAHMTAVLEKLGVKDRLQLALVLNERPINEKFSESQQSINLHANNRIEPFKVIARDIPVGVLAREASKLQLLV
jgi:two-component system, NarL family, nitrate/nitrite response regulator NarL